MARRAYSTVTGTWGDTHVSSGWYIDDINIVVDNPTPQIVCPQNPINIDVCELPFDLSQLLTVNYTDNVIDSNSVGMWANDTLSFTADTAGAYTFNIFATNEYGDDSCEFTINVRHNIPINVDKDKLVFSMTEGGEFPVQQNINISSICDIPLSWNIDILGNDEWFQQTYSTEFPNRIGISVNKQMPAGIYDAQLVITSANSDDPPHFIDVSLFVESGTYVGTDYIKPGETAVVPIDIFTTNPIKGYKIPLQYQTMQPDKVFLDSVVINPLFADSLILIPDSNGIMLISDDPTLPDDTIMSVAMAYFSAASDAVPEHISIDTATFNIDGTEYSYNFDFVDTTASNTASFNAGAVVISTCDSPLDFPVIVKSNSVDTIQTNLPSTINYPLEINNYTSVTITGTPEAAWNNDTLSFTAVSSGEYTYEVEAYSDCGVDYYEFKLYVDGITGGLKISDVDAPVGNTIAVPIIAMGDLNNIAGVEFHISYDSTILQPTGDTATSTYFTALTNVNSSTVHTAWANESLPFNLTEGDTIMVLWFEAIGNIDDTSSLEWVQNSHLVDPFGNMIEHDQTNGSVTIIENLEDISGSIKYYSNMAIGVPGIELSLEGSSITLDSSDTNGQYGFDNIVNESYLVTPSSDRRDPCVTVGDAVRMQRGIAGIEAFTPYQLIAGDISGDCRVSVGDIIKVLRDIVHLEDLVSGNWKFVDAAYDVDTSNWCTSPDNVMVEFSGSEISDVDFIGIRMGDVNGDYSTTQLFAKSSTESELNIITESETVYKTEDNVVSVPLTLNFDDAVTGFEYHIEYNKEELSYVGIINSISDKMLINEVDGVIHIVWMDTEKPTESDIVGNIEFSMNDNSLESTTLTYSNTEIVDNDGNSYQENTVRRVLSLENQATIPHSFNLSQNYPNPFNPSTVIELSLPEQSEYSLAIYNIAGQLVKEFAGESAPGVVRIEWDGRNRLGGKVSSGIYLYKVSAGTFKATKKMLLLK